MRAYFQRAEISDVVPLQNRSSQTSESPSIVIPVYADGTPVYSSMGEFIDRVEKWSLEEGHRREREVVTPALIQLFINSDDDIYLGTIDGSHRKLGKLMQKKEDPDKYENTTSLKYTRTKLTVGLSAEQARYLSMSVNADGHTNICDTNMHKAQVRLVEQNAVCINSIKCPQTFLIGRVFSHCRTSAWGGKNGRRKIRRSLWLISKRQARLEPMGMRLTGLVLIRNQKT